MRRVWKPAHLVLSLFQCILGNLIEPFQDIDLDGTTFSSTDVIQDAVDRFLRVVPSDSRLSVGQQLCVRLESVLWSLQH